jgi:subtilisin family serine protease
MRRLLTAALVATATLLGALAPASAQRIAPPPNVPPPPATTRVITPLGWYVIGSVGCAAVAPIIGTVVLGRELTLNEAYRTTFGCLLGPLGWLIADALVPPTVAPPPPPQPPPPRRTARGRNVSIPPRGATGFVPDEVLFESAAGSSARTLAALARRLHLTRLETHRFLLIDRTVQRWRIGGNRSVAATLNALARSNLIVAAQPNYLYALEQPAAPAGEAGAAQYVVSKLHLIEAHRLSTGAEVRVAVIDSKIDTRHPDLAGTVVAQDDVIGAAGPPHSHGTAMAGAIAAHSKLLGVAPQVRLLAVRAFSGGADSARGTTFNILKGLDWAAAEHARIVNMSFAGPADELMRSMVAHAHARGMVLIAAVGNAGPRSPPLYPAAYPQVIGVTAVGADNKLLPQANRGAQVAVAAPGVDVLADAPDDKFQLTSGTSVATALTSGVAALMLARDPALTPDALRQRLIGSAHKIAGPRRDVGAGVIDALAAVEAAGK